LDLHFILNAANYGLVRAFVLIFLLNMLRCARHEAWISQETICMHLRICMHHLLVAPHVLPHRYYISVADMNPSDYATHPTPCLQNLAPPLRFPHPLFWSTPEDGAVGLRNPASRDPSEGQSDFWETLWHDY
jgi:hypothetical protein